MDSDESDPLRWLNEGKVCRSPKDKRVHRGDPCCSFYGSEFYVLFYFLFRREYDVVNSSGARGQTCCGDFFFPASAFDIRE